MLSVGSVLSQKYMIERRLGGGGMGTVYAALNLVVNRRVAIKVMSSKIAESARLVARFRAEARAAATIGHANVVSVLDMGETDEGLPYVVMEHLQGEDLFDRLARVGTLGADEAVCIARQALAALDAAHRLGIIHCDLKPENIFLAERKDGCAVAKVLDFGVARFDTSAESGWSWDGVIDGTPAYMSPEQAQGKPIDQRSDVYAMGVILYEMLSGTIPNDGAEAVPQGPAPRLLDVAPDVDGELARIVDRAMAPSLPERYSSAAELDEALAPFAHTRYESHDAPVLLVRVRARSTSEVVMPLHRQAFRRTMAATIVALALLATTCGSLP